MSRIKSFYFDDIAQSDTSFNEPDIPSTCFILSEHDITTGETKPIHAYIFRTDAEDALRVLALGQRTFSVPEWLDYVITEVRSS
jgi:hypothetical protein